MFLFAINFDSAIESVKYGKSLKEILIVEVVNIVNACSGNTVFYKIDTKTLSLFI